MSELARQKRWDQGAFCEDLKHAKFPLIVTNYDISSRDFTDSWTPEMLSAIREAYAPAEHFRVGHPWNYYLYRPRQKRAKN